MSYEPDTQAALEIARSLVAAGVPVFLAYPDPDNKTGFTPAKGWQHATPDPSVIDRWRPGLALCALMGCGIDLVDFDPRNGGDPSRFPVALPRAVAMASTPSGGAHLFVASMGCGSRDNIAPGIDVKSGLPDGTGRGFAFIAPTIRANAETGEPVSYRWALPPRLELIGQPDPSTEPLAELVRTLRSDKGRKLDDAPDWYREFLDNREPQSTLAADKAIQTKLSEIAEWTADSGAGFRHTLMRAAMTLGGYVGGEHLDYDEAERQLLEAVSLVWGAPDDEDRKWIEQGLTDGLEHPFTVYDPEQLAAHNPAAQAVARQGELGPAPDDEVPWTVYHYLEPTVPFDPHQDTTDQGLAKAVATRMVPVLRYASDAGVWVKREKEHWSEAKDTSTMAGWSIATVAELMPFGDPNPPSNKSEWTEAHWQAHRRATFMSAQGSGRIAKKLREIVHYGHPATVTLTGLDANPEVLWAGGLPWDLRASGDVPVVADWIDPNTPHLKTAWCAPDPDVKTPRWDAFLAAVLPDEELRAWALRVLSVALTGYADAVTPILFGRERSGKTSLTQILVTVLGNYGHAASPKLLNAQDSSHDAIIYDLKGRRLSFVDEGPRQGHNATERLKQLTGGGVLTARAMYANPITFEPSHTLVMTTNTEPQLTDPALRARIRLIPCDEPEENVRPARLTLLGRALREEAPGILAQMMREAAGYLDDADSVSTGHAPTFVQETTEEIGRRQDPVREWVENCTVPAEPGTPGRTLYADYFARWHQEHPLHRRFMVPSETAFGRTLTDMGFTWQKIDGIRYRPLSPFWASGSVPGPSPRVNMGKPDISGTVREGSGIVKGGSENNPPAPQNPRSTTLSSSSLGGLEGKRVYKTSQVSEEDDQGHIGAIYRESLEEVPSTVRTVPEDHSAPPLTCINGPTPGENKPSGASTSRPEAVSADFATEDGDGPVTESGAKRTKDEERQLRLDAASGPLVGLPALVTRDGMTVPVQLSDAAALLEPLLLPDHRLSVDVETTGYPLGHRHYALRTVQLGSAQFAIVLDAADDEQRAFITDKLARAHALQAFSATADLAPLAHAGLAGHDELWARMHDVIIPAKLSDPKLTGSDAGSGLKQLAQTLLGDQAVAPEAEKAKDAVFKAGRWLKNVKHDTPPERSGWAQIEPGSETMVRYAGSDVLDTAAVAAKLPPVDPVVYERERAFQQMTARVSFEGVRVDGEHVAELTETHRQQRSELARQLHERGVDNPGSNVQVGEALVRAGAQDLPLSEKSGKPSVAADVLEKVKAQGGDAGQLAEAVLGWRQHQKALSAFLEPYDTLVRHGDGRARPTIYTLSADTGRTSCVSSDALVEMPRDLVKYPDGVPITEVREGDWVYAFDHDRELVLRRVKWVAQTGVKQTMIITVENSVGHRLTLRATPDHLIRLRNGDWRATARLLDTPGKPRRDGGPRVMTMVRRRVDDGYIKFFPHSVAQKGAGVKGGGKNREHRWVLSQVLGKNISTKVDVHHIDGNRANNHPDNLQELPRAEHRGNRDLAWGVKTVAPNLPSGPTDYRVISVEPGLVEPVWDMEVEDVHNFIANGICVHNCVRPNAQQLPRSGGFRACFTADPGELIISADFSGVEIRVAAALSQDESLSRFIHDEDAGLSDGLHWAIAREVWGPEATKAERYAAKAIVFGTLYSGGPETLAKQAGISVSLAASAQDVLRELAPGLTRWSDQIRQAVRSGRTDYPSYSGRVIHFPADYPHKGPNFAIQGSARELLVDAMLRWRDTQWGQARLIPVHDEIVTFVPADEAQAATQALIECMESELFGVRIKAEPGEPSFAWADSV